MEIAASIKGASKEYKTGDTVITALQPTTFDFMKNELTHNRSFRFRKKILLLVSINNLR